VKYFAPNEINFGEVLARLKNAKYFHSSSGLLKRNRAIEIKGSILA